MKKLIIVTLALIMSHGIQLAAANTESGSDAAIVAIPSNGNTLDATLYQSFSRCAYFCIYNRSTQEHYFIENEQQDTEGGASRQVVHLLKEKGVTEVYTTKVGPNAERSLNRHNIKIHLVEEEITVGDLINSIRQ